MSDGTLSIRRRQKGKETNISALESLEMLHIGEGAASSKQAIKALKDVDELRVNENRRQKRLKNYDKFLKAFKYSAALDSVLPKVRFPV
jgi:U3 small nucleolar RNA-associated protein 15